MMNHLAQERLDAIGDMPILDLTEGAENLADRLVKQVPLPENAEVDALHIATATINGMNYLLTWNCAHIANAALRQQIEATSQSAGCDSPVICTPQQLMGN